MKRKFYVDLDIVNNPCNLQPRKAENRKQLPQTIYFCALETVKNERSDTTRGQDVTKSIFHPFNPQRVLATDKNPQNNDKI